jgi:hypothetical protein
MLISSSGRSAAECEKFLNDQMKDAKSSNDTAKVANIETLLDLVGKKKAEGKPSPSEIETWKSNVAKLGTEFLEKCTPTRDMTE